MCPVLSGTKTLAEDPFSPTSCKVGLLQTGFGVPAHPTDVNWLGNLEPKATPWTLFHVPQTIPEQFFVAWQGALSCQKRYCYQGTPLPQRSVCGLQQSLGRWYVSKYHPPECQGPRFPSRTLPRASASLSSSHCASWCISSPGKQRTWTQPSTRSKRKCSSSDQAPFFTTLWSSSDSHIPHCRHFWQWTEATMGTLTILQLDSPICCKLENTVCSDTFLLWPALGFQQFEVQ